MSDPYNSVGDHIGFDDNVPLFSSLLFFQQRLERKFWCMDGPPVAYFEIGDARVVYETIQLRRQGGLDEVTVHELCSIAWGQFIEPALQTMPDEDFSRSHRLLFWRKRPTVSVVENAVNLRMRLAIPGYQICDYTKPAIEITEANGARIGEISATELFPWPRATS